MVTGLYGIGKSHVARNTLHFLAERKYFRYALIWVRLDGLEKVSDLVKDLFVIVLHSLQLTENQKQEVMLANQNTGDKSLFIKKYFNQ